ncbi:MAG TPA: family 78 glycoside hydrolase catalytic domain [Micromonosporaceae bacterium]|nr:family 78 glycoside hydrolase catalytic domain [Micromonosporaceae bacterium]
MTGPGLTAYGLSCELLREPLGIDEPRPRLSWKLASDRRGAAQRAYRVRVATRAADLADPDRLCWDTGVVSSDETLHLAYDGTPLVSTTRYHWRVEVWDADGEPGAGAASWFETALLHRDEWVARWIGRDPAVAPPMDPPQGSDHSDRASRLDPPAQLRRSFVLATAPVRARLYATARGVYQPRINGQRVGDVELAPGWTEYAQRLLYQTYDVTDLLAAGENVIAAALADGWWSGYVGFDPRRAAQHYGDAPYLLAQMVMDFADGSRRVLGTDSRWLEHEGALRYADLLVGECHDARAATAGWDRPGFDVAGWMPVRLGDDSPAQSLLADPAQPVRVVDELTPVSIEGRGDGRFRVDLGQNMVGRVRLSVPHCASGTRIELRHAEMLTDDGELYLANLRSAEATDVYLTAGRAGEVFEPAFTFHGFRYVEVRGYPGDLHPAAIVGRVLSSDTPPAGEFTCSDDTVMRLQSNIRWGQRGNFLAIPTDCPQRDERLGWTADAQIFLPTACRNADVSAFFARWMGDVVAGQDDDGAFGDMAPRLLLLREGAPAWGDGGVIVPWHLYRTYGDRRVLERSYPAMAAWVEHIHRNNPDLVWRNRVGNHYGDWLQVDARTPREVLATAYFARSTRLVAHAAQVLGHDDDAGRYADLADAVRDAFRAAFVSPDARVTGETQTCYLLALAFDLLPRHLVAPAVEHLVGDIRARGNHLSTGFVGVALLCPTLTDHGHAELAYALLHQDTYPSWGYSIAHGATTIWERWDGWTEDRGFQSAAMNSFNHYSLGSVGDWLYGRVAGLDQASDSVADRRLVLRPTPGGRLTWASARYASPRGEASCGWRLTPEAMQYDVVVPVGSTAALHLPTDDPSGAREGGAAVAESPGVDIVAITPTHLVLHLVAGRYRFTAKPPAAVNGPATS